MKRIVWPILGLTAVITTAMATSPLDTPQNKLSYAMGYETGRAFKAHNVEVDTKVYAEGLQDGVNGTSPQLSEAQIQQVLADFQKDNIAKVQNELKQEADKNQKDGLEFLAKNKTEAGVVTTASGLQYKVVTKGTGPVPTASDTVLVDYEGKLLDGKVFDSSYQRGQPVSLPVRGVIKGWQEALTLMPVGSTWQLYIPADLAYGPGGAPGAIGPNSTLIFKVHLISIQK